MLIRKPDDISSSEITSKSTYLSRRKFISGGLAAGAALAGGFYLRDGATHREDSPVHADGPKLPGVVKSQFSTTEKPTSFQDITNYNNYYEFSTDKYEPNGLSKNFRTRPWTVKIGGLVSKPLTLDIDDIMKLAPLEERIYRHRCVEGWSMVIPWVGFPLSALIKRQIRCPARSLLHSRRLLRRTRCPTRSATTYWTGLMLKACAWMKPCIRWPSWQSASMTKFFPMLMARLCAWWCRGNMASRASRRS